MAVLATPPSRQDQALCYFPWEETHVSRTENQNDASLLKSVRQSFVVFRHTAVSMVTAILRSLGASDVTETPYQDHHFRVQSFHIK